MKVLRRGRAGVFLGATKAAGQIGLVGVHPDARGNGVGAALVNAGLRWFGSVGARDVAVVTQGQNVTAQRLYQRCGFATSRIELWYHKWFSFVGRAGGARVLEPR